MKRLRASTRRRAVVVGLALVALLAAIVFTKYRSSVQHAREAALKGDLFKMRDAIDQFYADRRTYPETLHALVSAGYLRSVPQDPMTRSADTWVTVPPERASSREAALYDIKSGSPRRARDGSRYADW